MPIMLRLPYSLLHASHRGLSDQLRSYPEPAASSINARSIPMQSDFVAMTVVALDGAGRRFGVGPVVRVQDHALSATVC
jgi:hypothetical protein